MIRFLWIVFTLCLAATLAAEFFIGPHAHFGIDALPFFNAWFGFLACAAIIVVSKLIGVFLKRPLTYYGGKQRDN